MAGVPVVAAFDFAPGGWWWAVPGCMGGTLGQLGESHAEADTSFETATGNRCGPVSAIAGSWRPRAI